MDNPGLPEALWSHLDGWLWHATGRDGLHGIVADKEIRVAVSERYVNSFCRNQGCVSLFDFGPASKNISNQFRNWCGWFGRQQATRVAVWLEIDRASVRESLRDAKEVREDLERLMDHRRAEGTTCGSGIKIIPGVEACHKGPIPISAVAGVLLIDRHNRDLFQAFSKPNDDTTQQIDAFEKTLPAHQVHQLEQAILADRRRRQAAASDE